MSDGNERSKQEKTEKAVELFIIANALNSLMLKQSKEDYVCLLGVMLNYYGEGHDLTGPEIVSMAEDIAKLQKDFQRELGRI